MIMIYRRVAFIHETGLAVAYGLIIGAIIRLVVVNFSINMLKTST